MVVNPEITRQQFEGAAVFGTSIVRCGEITATNGRADQSNFHDYRVARMNDAPVQTNVTIVDSSAPPGGVGALQRDLCRNRQARPRVAVVKKQAGCVVMRE